MVENSNRVFGTALFREWNKLEVAKLIFGGRHGESNDHPGSSRVRRHARLDAIPHHFGSLALGRSRTCGDGLTNPMQVMA
jgi:hypothetical protein